MTFALHLDAERWRAHHAGVLATTPGLVPVVKGNGYGFGLSRLAEECRRLGVRTVAVGLPGEAADVRSAFPGDVLVLTPWHPRLPAADITDDAVIRTVSHAEALEALEALATPPAAWRAPDTARSRPRRVVLELRTSMRRHGLPGPDLGRAAATSAEAERRGALQVEGLALHLPMVGDRLGEARRLLAEAAQAGLQHDVVWVSHLDPAEVLALAADQPGRDVRLRSGTHLWLGDPDAFRARGTVLDVHKLAPGDAYGYRAHHVGRVRPPGWLVVVGGGTSHGVALEAPSSVPSLRSRAQVLALAGLEAAGHALSPFSVAGARRPFAEPPHMQVSMVLLPPSVTPPQLGDELDVTVRMTTVSFDDVVEGPLR